MQKLLKNGMLTMSLNDAAASYALHVYPLGVGPRATELLSKPFNYEQHFLVSQISPKYQSYLKH